MQSKLIILDKEIGAGLAKYVMSRNRLMSVVLCDSLDGFIRAYDDGKDSIGLIGRDYLDASKGKLEEREKTLFILEEREKLQGGNSLHRYQAADQLLKKMYARLMETGTFLSGTSVAMYDKRIVGICAPLGTPIQTELAFVYALKCSLERNTLFLSFNYYSGFFDSLADSDHQHDIGDLFYEMKKGAGAGLAIESMVHTAGRLDYVLPVSRQMDLEDLQADDLAGLFGRLPAESEYEVIVLDLPARPSFLRAAYHLTSQLYVLREEGKVSEKSVEYLKADLKEGPSKNQGEIKELILKGSYERHILNITEADQLLNGQLFEFIKREMDS